MSLSSTVSGSTAVTLSNAAQMNDAPPLAAAASIDPFTASEVIFSPSWNVTPSRRWNVHVRPSVLLDQLVARTGVNFSADDGGLIRRSGS